MGELNIENRRFGFLKYKEQKYYEVFFFALTQVRFIDFALADDNPDDETRMTVAVFNQDFRLQVSDKIIWQT